jgi:protein TonB
MNRLQKKCFIASTSLHLLLVLVFLVCSAFLASNSRPSSENVQIINFVPMVTMDGPVTPNPGASAAPPAPAPIPAPPAPTPPAQPVRNTPAVEPVREPKHVVVPDFTKAGSKSTTPPKTKPSVSTENSDQAARQRIADQFRQATHAIGSSMSGSTKIELSGSGTVGVADWLSAVVSIYQRTWQMPVGITQDFPPVRTSITIARDGSVISKRMTGSSGIPEVDASIQETLERITQTVPLPEAAKEDERTVIINFTKDKTG